jgi:hypothetical protein
MDVANLADLEAVRLLAKGQVWRGRKGLCYFWLFFASQVSTRLPEALPWKLAFTLVWQAAFGRSMEG